jgi:hypothetical protein
LDQCPEEKGLKINQGCPETQAPPTIDDTRKLQNGEAVMVPSAFGNYVVTKKWLRLKNNRYEYSDYEKRTYKPVNTKETVKKLNAFYGLQVPVPQQNPKPKSQGVKGPKPQKTIIIDPEPKMPKPQKTIIVDPEPKMPKPPQGNGLTRAEEAELNGLIYIAQTRLLTSKELARMKDLEMKKNKQ